MEVPEHSEVTLLGAAMLAGIGAGLFSSIGEAIAATRFTLRQFGPSAQAHSLYSELFESAFMPAAPALRAINHELTARFVL